MASTVEILLQARDQASGPIHGVSGALGSLGSLAGGAVVGGLLALTAAAAGVAVGLGALAVAAVKGNAEFERYETQFSVLLGSVDAAKERLADLAEFGAKTPFELPEVVRADKILQSFGLHAEDAAERFGFAGEQIRTIAGDVSAGTGASFEEISRYIGMFSTGATGLAISRFQELGIVTRAQLTEMGLEFSKAGELMTPVDDAMDVLLLSMQNKFGGMMEAQSATLEGMLSNFEDWKGATIRKLGEPIFDAVKDQMGSLLKFLGSPQVMGAIENFSARIGEVLARLIPVISDIVTSFAALIGTIVKGGDIGKAFAQFSDVFEEWPIIQRIIGGVGMAIGALVGFFQTNLPLMQATAASVFGSIQAIFATVAGVVTETVLPALKRLFGDSVSQMPPFQQAFEGAMAAVVTAFSDLSDWLSENEGVIIGVLVALGVAVAAFVYGAVIPGAIAAITALAPIVLPLIAIAAVVALLYEAWTNNWGGIQEKTAAVWAVIQPLLAQAQAWLQVNIPAAVAFLMASWTAAWPVIQATVSDAMATIRAVISTVLSVIQASWAAHGESIMTIVTTAFNFIVAGIGVAMANTQTVITFILNAIQAFWDAWGATILAIITNMLESVGFVFDAFAALFTGDWDALGQALRNIWDNAWDNIVMLVRNAFDVMMSIDWGSIGNAIMVGVATGVANAAHFLIDAARNAARAAYDAAVGFLGIHSPSTLFAGIGQDMMRGMALGITAAAPLAAGAMAGAASQVTNSAVSNSYNYNFNVQNAAPISETTMLQTARAVAGAM